MAANCVIDVLSLFLTFGKRNRPATRSPFVRATDHLRWFYRLARSGFQAFCRGRGKLPTGNVSGTLQIVRQPAKFSDYRFAAQLSNCKFHCDINSVQSVVRIELP